MSEFEPIQEIEPARLVIQVMPDKELLEEFINGGLIGNGPQTVYFDIEQGRFIKHGENTQ